MSENKPLWSGRFASDPAAALWDFTVDLEIDEQLWPYDIAVNRAHARMLDQAGIISDDNVKEILSGLDAIESEFTQNKFVFTETDEDIHTAIERRLTELVGEAGASIHAARSRNDQVATDFRLWCRDAAESLIQNIDALTLILCEKAEEVAEMAMPGYTHLQRAQPITVGHALAAYVEMFGRDVERLRDALDRINTGCPLGAGALATTTLPINPEQTAVDLGFTGPFSNSIDAVSSRDFALELAAAASISAVNLSRLAEEIVLWSSKEFGFIELDDAWATGSSMMPQKKNPDIAELARGSTGRIVGGFVSLLTTMKGLPLSYNRDMQEDKAAVFTSVNRLNLALIATRGFIESMKFNADKISAAVGDGFTGATDLAEQLVKAGIPFRRAHELIGDLVKKLADVGRTLADVTNGEFVELHESLADCTGEWLSPHACIERRRLPGGPHPDAVTQEISLARNRIAERQG